MWFYSLTLCMPKKASPSSEDKSWVIFSLPLNTLDAPVHSGIAPSGLSLRPI